MDPFTIALAGTIGFAGLLRGLEFYLGREKAKPQPKQFDYKNRWDDPEYVDIIHRTIAAEKENGFEVLTECKCAKCTAPPKLDKTLPPPRGDNFFKIHGSPIKTKDRIVNIGGWEHQISDIVPVGADVHVTLGENSHQVVTFKWWDSLTGEPVVYMSTSATPARPKRQQYTPTRRYE